MFAHTGAALAHARRDARARALGLLAWAFLVAVPRFAGAQAPVDASDPLPPTVSAPAVPAPVDAARVALLPVGHFGVDAIVPQRVGEAVANVLRELGYSFADPATVARAWAMLRPTDPPSAADVFRATQLASAGRGVHIRIGVEGGAYFMDLLVASADGSGPFRAHAVGGPNDFLQRCADAVRATMPTPAAFDAAAAEQYAAQARAMTPRAPTAAFAPATFTPRYRTAAPIGGPRFGLTIQTESAFGRNTGTRFYNHLVGARLDVRLGRNVYVDGYVGYVNLDRGNQRASNMLFYVQLEDRLSFAATGRVQFPLRLAVGFMPLNGPFIRMAGGIRFPLGGQFEMGVDVVAPTIWWVPGGRHATYDLGLELTYRFGPR